MEKHDPQPEQSDTRLAIATGPPFPATGAVLSAAAPRATAPRCAAVHPALRPVDDRARASTT